MLILDRPISNQVKIYNLEKIYKYVKRLYCQKEGIKAAKARGFKLETLKACEVINSAIRVLLSTIAQVVKEVKRQEETAKTRLLANVDKEVKDLIKAIGSIIISLAKIQNLINYQIISLILKHPANYAYFIV